MNAGTQAHRQMEGTWRAATAMPMALSLALATPRPKRDQRGATARPPRSDDVGPPRRMCCDSLLGSVLPVTEGAEQLRSGVIGDILLRE
jgi:hypothetical protein